MKENSKSTGKTRAVLYIFKPLFSPSFVFALLATWLIFAMPVSAAEGNKEFKRIAERYLQFYFRHHPVAATSCGVHDYDSQLNDITPEGRAQYLKSVREFDGQLNGIVFEELSRENQIDWNLIKADISASILDMDSIKSWRNNPDKYSSYVNTAIFTLVQRDFAPFEKRLGSLIEREEKIPLYLARAKSNLEASQVPRIFASIALTKIPGILSFFEKDLVKQVSSEAKKIKQKQLLVRFSEVNSKSIEALKDYKRFLENEIMPETVPEFALGEDLYKKKLYSEELVDDSIDNLIRRGEKELSRLQKQFKDCAATLDKKKTAVQVFESIASRHPAPDRLISSVSGVLEDIRRFCVEKPVVTIPGEERVVVAETPPFMRALTFASMDTPGPFEKNAKGAFYFVTLPEKDWDKKQVEEHMRSFSDQDLLNTSIHEAYPGHYVQFLWVNRAVSDIRKVFGCSSNAEGWAHYCEEMMLEEDFRNAGPELRITQVHDALLRVCRYIVGLKMHTRGMSLEEGIQFFEEEGFQEHANAEREAKRGTMDPTYLVYTLGKLEILSMRESFRSKAGASFNLKEFHDLFLKQGYPPLALVRAQMLQEKVKKFF